MQSSFCPVPGNTRYSTTVSLTTTFLKGAKGGRADGHRAASTAWTGRLATGLGRGARRRPASCAPSAQASFLYFPGSEQPDGVPKRQRTA